MRLKKIVQSQEDGRIKNHNRKISKISQKRGYKNRLGTSDIHIEVILRAADDHTHKMKQLHEEISSLETERRPICQENLELIR